MRVPIHAVLLAVLLIPLQQEETTVAITVNSLEQTYEGGVATFSGNPIVTYGDMRFEADDQFIYIEETGELKGGPRVTFTRGVEMLTGREFEFNIQSRAGVLRNVSGQLNDGLLIEAAEARRLANGHYELTDVTITTCRNIFLLITVHCICCKGDNGNMCQMVLCFNASSYFCTINIG